MERKSKLHKYLQICVGDNPSPMLLKLNKDNTLEIKFNSKNKKQNSYHRVWIPPPAKTSKGLPIDCTHKYPKNQIIISVPDDAVLLPVSEENIYTEYSERKTITTGNSPAAVYNKTQIMKDNFSAQYNFIGEAERLLKEHDNKQKVLLKYCQTLKKNMQDISKSIKELENQDNTPERKDGGKKDTVHSDSQDDIKFSQIKFSQIKRTGAPKKLERSSSLEDVPKMYLPSIEWRRNEENRTENKSSRTGSVPKCEPAENLMMKLSDNMRKTKLLIEAVCQEDEVVNSLQRKYTSDVEKLYQEQQTLLNQLYQSFDATNSVFTDSRVANDEEDIRQNEALIKRRTKEEHNPGQDIQKNLEDRLAKANRKLLSLKKELEIAKTPLMKYTEEAQIDRDMSAPVNSQNNQFEPERTFQNHFNRKYKNTGTKSSDSSKNADCVCQTQIREIVHRCRPHTSAEQSSSSKPKHDDFITETKIEQTIHLPPKNIVAIPKVGIESKTTDILRDINATIDKLTPSFEYASPVSECEYYVEEGNITPDDFSFKTDQSQYHTTKTPVNNTFKEKYDEIEESYQKYKDRRMPPKFKSGKPMQSDQQYRDEARSDSTQSFTQLSLMEECDCPGECNNENHLAEFSSFKQHDPHESRTSPKFAKEKSMQSRDDRQSDPFESRMRPKFTKEKSMQSDPFESRMRPKSTKDKTMQSRDDRQSDFTQLSLMEECDCPGECNNENHFANISSFKQSDPFESRMRPKSMKDKSMQSRDDRQSDPFESRMRPKSTKDKSMQSRDDRQSDPFESRMRPKSTKDKSMQSRDDRQSDPFESRMRPKFTKEKSMQSRDDRQSDPFESRMRPKFTKEKSMQSRDDRQSDPFESRMRPKFTKEKSMQSRDDRQSGFTQLSLMEECDCPGKCNNENHFAEFSSLRQDTRESRNRSNLQNELIYKNLNLKQALIPNRTPITNNKYKTKENYTSDQINKKNFQSNNYQTPTNSPNFLNETKLHYEDFESIKNASYPIQKERQIQADMSEFVYTTPTSSSKEKFISPFLTSTPKKIIHYDYTRAKGHSVSKNAKTPRTSNVENVANKINGLYKDIMTQF